MALSCIILRLLRNYKFEFAIRNKRVRSEWRIYKFYTLYALARKFTAKPNLLSVSERKQKVAAKGMLDILSNEEKFIE